MAFVRTDADNVRDAYVKLMKNLDRSYSSMHAHPTAPLSINYEMIACDLKDAMDAANEICRILKERGL